MYSRNKWIPIDNLVFRTEILGDIETFDKIPFGTFIIGLYLDGFRVNEKELCFKNSNRKELLFKIGIIK